MIHRHKRGKFAPELSSDLLVLKTTEDGYTEIKVTPFSKKKPIPVIYRKVERILKVLKRRLDTAQIYVFSDLSFP